MAPSDTPAPARTSGGPRLRRALLAVFLLVVVAAVARVALAGLGLFAHFGPDLDGRRFDELQARMNASRQAFTTAASRMGELRSAHDDATKIAWTLMLSCVTDAGEGEACNRTTPSDRTVYARLPNVDVVVYQRKDGDRIFFRFYGDDPPVYHLMYAAGDPGPEKYAGDHGFRAARVLGGGWTLLGPIEDDARERAQWIR